MWLTISDVIQLAMQKLISHGSVTASFYYKVLVAIHSYNICIEEHGKKNDKSFSNISINSFNVSLMFTNLESLPLKQNK